MAASGVAFWRRRLASRGVRLAPFAAKTARGSHLLRLLRLFRLLLRLLLVRKFATATFAKLCKHRIIHSLLPRGKASSIHSLASCLVSHSARAFCNIYRVIEVAKTCARFSRSLNLLWTGILSDGCLVASLPFASIGTGSETHSACLYFHSKRVVSAYRFMHTFKLCAALQLPTPSFTFLSS